MEDKKSRVLEIYRLLLEHFGPQYWWPGDTPFEIMVGAVLTQAVAWKNVEKAINQLKNEKVFSIENILATPPDNLADMIRPALYHQQKAKKLIILMNFIKKDYNGDLDKMFAEPLPYLRSRLLSLWGIGPETADSILLYAGNYPVFVVDKYTQRIFSRLGMVDEKISYQEMQEFMHACLPRQTQLFNEYHALLVRLGATKCLKNKTRCQECPLEHFCKYKFTMQELL